MGDIFDNVLFSPVKKKVPDSAAHLVTCHWQRNWSVQFAVRS